jgi:hypothetical protein
MPFANREAMNLHLREISQCVSEGAHAPLVVDGAGWPPAPGLVDFHRRTRQISPQT